ncbi:MAG: methyltransferase domain-containing protein [Saprospiraceae bacterium]|nr:methyltransferase domain-containing protein [Saprospiraceae bacterium]
MNIVFGRMQDQMSGRMRKHPTLARIIRKIFGYTLVGNYARALTFKRLLEKIPGYQLKKILDLGCGYGEYSFMMAEAFPKAEVTALDLNAKSVQDIDRLARKNGFGNLKTHIGPIDTLEEPNASYDFIFSVDVFEHIKEEEMPFVQAYEKLRPGGYLLVKIPNRDQLTILPEQWFEEHHDWLEDEHIGQIYDLEGLRQRMEKEGFDIIYEAYGDGWWSRLGWELGYLSHKAGPVLQLVCLPLAKLLVRVDFLFNHRNGGNTIQVIGRKKEG